LFKLLFLVSIAASVSSAVSAAPTAQLSPAAKRDVQCVTLALVAVSTVKDPTKQQGIIAESWYFLGRLAADAPDTDLKQATANAFVELKGSPHIKNIGSDCDAEFGKRGVDLTKLGG
jgi:hypothetical protein